MSKLLESREREWQFAAGGFDAVRDWMARQPSVRSLRRFQARATLELMDTYFDSADWKMFAAGFALRWRRTRDPDGAERQELTLKALRAARDGFADRVESSERIDTDLVAFLANATPLARRVRALVGPRRLEPLFTAHTRREREHWLEADSDIPLAEVDLDDTTLRAPSGATRKLLRVEVESLNADPEVLQPMVDELRAAASLEPSRESKFHSGLNLAGLQPTAPWKPPPHSLSADAPFRETAQQVLAKYFGDLLGAEPRARLGDEAAVHQMRVSARRLHVLLKSFARYAPIWAVRARQAVQSLIATLGEVRDADVQLAYLAGDRAAQEPMAIAPLRTRLEAERSAAHERLLERLDTEATQAWLTAWRREFDAGIRSTHGMPVARTGDVSRALIRAQARKLRKRADAIDEASGSEAYHEVRIRAKRLRYLVGAFASLYGPAAVDYERALARLQDLLGAQHDAAMRAARFSALAQDELPAEAAFAIGRMVERDARDVVPSFRHFAKAYRRIRRRRWRALQTAMKSGESE